MNPRHYLYIDALRGYAILLVMAVHASQAIPGLTGTGRLLLDQGARGVQLFFVASALTLLFSWNYRNDGALAFYFRRFFRIAPMFWLGIMFFVWLEGMGPRYFAPNGINFFDIFLTIIFFHGFHPETITSVVHGGWSIAVEMTFYALFPAFVFWITSLQRSILAIFLSMLFAKMSFLVIWSYRHVLFPHLSDDMVNTFLTLWFFNQLPVFFTGFALYYIIRDFSGYIPIWALQLGILISSICFIWLAINPTIPNKIYLNLYTAYGFCFGIFAFCLSQGGGKWLVNSLIRYLGKISFSAYLWHFAILGTIGKVSQIGFNPMEYMSQSKPAIFFFQFFIYIILTTTFFLQLHII